MRCTAPDTDGALSLRLWGIFPRLLLLALSMTVLGATNPGITVQVSSETAPPGGFAQFKVSLTAPALVSQASISMSFDPTIFGPIASIAAFSATGDQTGDSSIYSAGQKLQAALTSESSSLGQLPGLPVFVVTVPVLATAKIGATSSISFDPSPVEFQSINSWGDPHGNPYALTINPGTFTVGGSLSIQGVTPGGGLLPSGNIVQIDGTGFDATTTVVIDGVRVASTQLVSPQQINLTLGGSTEMNGKHVHVSNASGESRDYFPALSFPVTFQSSLFAMLILPSLPSPASTVVQWPLSEGDIEFFTCLQNPGAAPVTVTYYTLPFGESQPTSQSVVVPPFGTYAELTNFLVMAGPSLQFYMTASAPLKMALVTIHPESFVPLVGVPAQLTSLPPGLIAEADKSYLRVRPGITPAVSPGSGASLAGQLSLTPSSLTLTAPAGTSASGVINVSAASGTPSFSLEATNLDPNIFESSVPIQYSVSPASSTNEFTAPATIQVSESAFLVTEGGSMPAIHYASLTVSWNGGQAIVPVTIYGTATPSTPPVMSAIVSAGSAAPGAITPGELISIFGVGLGGVPSGLQLDSSGEVATNLGGTQVLINDVAAPLIYVSPGQVNALVPFDAGSDAASIQVVAAGLPSGAWAVPLAPSAPSIFTTSASGVGQAAVVNQDGSVNSASNPASRGTAIQIYATGGGQTSPPSSTAIVATGQASLTLPVSVTVGGVNAQVLYAGAAPGEIEGVVQVNVMVPQSVTQGVALPVLVTIGNVTSQTGVTVAIR